MTDRRHVPIGQIVKVRNLEQQVMIVGLFPIVEKNGEQGYFDYSAVYTPIGLTGPDSLFFNKEDIEELIFIGYIDAAFQNIDSNYEKLVSQIDYPKFNVKDFNSND